MEERSHASLSQELRLLGDVGLAKPPDQSPVWVKFGMGSKRETALPVVHCDPR